MQKLQIKIEPITEEQISDLISFLDTGIIPEWTTEGRLAMTYGRLRARWEKMEKAEAWLEKDRQKKRESYKWKILNEIKQWTEDMKNESRWVWHYIYEMVNIKFWEKWRTMQLGFPDTDVNNVEKRRHSILIEEWENPEFFDEMLQKYMPKETANYEDKPF